MTQSLQDVVVLSVRGLSKTYPGQIALDDVDMDLRRGEVHALLGGNGSGKSTLIKVLAGYHAPDPGSESRLNGSPFSLGSAEPAHAAGMRFVHQDLALVPTMSILDNLALGETYQRRWWLNDARESRAVTHLLDRLDLDVDPRAALATLSPAQRTVVALARALRSGFDHTSVLVLDEPTANLPPHDVNLVLSAVRRARDAGVAVLYVTHRLHEVFDIADRLTVLRDGKIVLASPVSNVSPAELVTAIAGSPLDELYPHAPVPRTSEALTVEGLSGLHLQDLSFTLREGEILGIAGITGSGRETVNSAVFGCAKDHSGSVSIRGESPRALDPASAIDAGIAFIPADRQTQSAHPSLAVRENITLPHLLPGRLQWLGIGRERTDVRDWLVRTETTPADPDRLVSELSGGNQQKVVLARWLRRASSIFLVDEPTQGVDVTGKRAIYDALHAVASDGAAVVVSSSDAEELAGICHRVIVLDEGRVVAVIERDALSAQNVISAMLKEKDPA